MGTIRDATWPEIEGLRGLLSRDLSDAPSLAAAAQCFVDGFSRSFETVVLARVFYVTPVRRLPAVEQQWATEFAAAAGRSVPLDPETPVLVLVGTAGREPGWNDRQLSAGHRAIPLVDKKLVDGAPMLAALLAALDLDIAQLLPDAPIQLRHLSGGLNARFYVPDARTTTDARGRLIIVNEAFVAKHGIRTVFGMGGAYLDGSLIAAILFTREQLSALEIDRFPSLIGTFKIATGTLVAAGSLMASPS